MSLAEQQWCPTSVQVTVLQARGLRVKGKGGTNDAYAVMQVGKEKYQTSVAEKSVAPVWKEEAAFDLPPLHQGGGGGTERGTLHVHVLHRALVGPDKLLGQAVLNLLQLTEDKTRNKTEWFKLLDKSGKADKDRGEVLVNVQFMRNNMTASMFDLSAAGKSRSRLGKFKDKVRGKKKEPDASSTVVPSFPQVLTDSEEDTGGDDEVAAGKDEKKKKKHKMKSLFTSKSNLQRNMSQSMSVLPAKNSSLSSSQSSGLNVDSEGKKKFKFMIHKRSGSSDSKDSSSGHRKPGAAEQSNLCINGSHIYREEPQPRTSRMGSSFSLASSGLGSMEDVPGSSPPSVDSLRAVREYSPWREEQEDEETAEAEDGKEDMVDLRGEDEERMKMEEERRRKEEVEEKARRQEELERLAEERRRQEEEERRRRAEEERVKMEEEEKIRRVEEKRRQEEEERRRIEDERVKREEEERKTKEEEEDRKRQEEERRRRAEEERVKMEEEERRRKEEEEESARRQAEELERLAEERRRKEEEEERRRKEEEEERRRAEEKRVKREEEERIRREKEMVEEERRRQEEEERTKRKEEEQEEKRRLEEQERKREERIRMEEERARDERRRQEEEERVRREEEERKLEEEKRQIEERRVEEEKAEKEEAERIRREEEKRRQEEEEMMKRLEEEREEKRMLEEQERRWREEEERIKKEERASREKEEYERLVEERRKLEEERKRIEAEEKIRREEEERVRKEEERERLAEEKRILEEQERRRIEEEEKVKREEEERTKLEEERARKEKEEYERLVKMRQEEQERRKNEEEERFRKEEQEMNRMEEERKRRKKEDEERAKKEKEGKEEEQEKRREDQTRPKAAERKSRVAASRPDEVTSTNPFDEDVSNNPFEENPSSPAAKVSPDQQRCHSAGSSVGSKAASSGEKDLISTHQEKRPAPQPPGRNQAETPREQHRSAQHLAQINKQSKDKDARTVSVPPQRSVQVIPPLRRSPTDAKNAQSTKATTEGAKHSKRPAPARPRPVEEGPKTAPSSEGSTPHERGSGTKREPVVYGLNPFEDNEDENELTAQDDTATSGSAGSAQWPPAASHAADKDTAPQTKIKSSKMTQAPPLPAKQVATDDTAVTLHDNSVTHACGPESEAVSPVHGRETPLDESQHASMPRAGEKKEKKEEPLRRLQPVKPLNPLDQQPVSVNKGGQDHISTEVQEKTKVNDSGLKGPYSQLTQQELVSLVLKQEKQLLQRDKKISELEQYIDNLLVRVIEEKPSILMSLHAA